MSLHCNTDYYYYYYYYYYFAFLFFIQTSNVKWRVAIFIIILNNSDHSIDSYLVDTQCVISVCSMTEATAKDIEALEPCVKCFLAVLGPSNECLHTRLVLLFSNNNFIRLTLITTVPNYQFTFLQFKVKGTSVPIFRMLWCTTTKYIDIMCRWKMWSTYPDNSWLMYSKRELIFLWSKIMLD